jgi:Na+-driven multidrug efflux pump
MVSVCIYLTHFLRKNCTLRPRLPEFDFGEVRRIFFNGSSSFLMEFSQSAIAFSFNLVLMARIGASGVAAYSIVMYICSMFNMVLIGIVQGAQPIISYNHGSGNTENENKVYRLGLVSNLVLTAFFYLAIFFFGGQLAGLFSKDNPVLVRSAFEMMRLYFLGFFPIGISLMNILYFQTTEREGKSIALSALRCIGFVQLALVILPGLVGTTGIYLSLLAGELVNCVISIILYVRVKGEKKLDAHQSKAAKAMEAKG